MPECVNLTYEERLQEMELNTLEGRRERENLITIYKLMNNLEETDIKRSNNEKKKSPFHASHTYVCCPPRPPVLTAADSIPVCPYPLPKGDADKGPENWPVGKWVNNPMKESKSESGKWSKSKKWKESEWKITRRGFPFRDNSNSIYLRRHLSLTFPSV